MSQINILIIPDGNRRWAKERGEDYGEGYRQLPIIISRIIDTLKEEGINKLFIWGNSIANLERSKEQVNSFLNNYLDILNHISNKDELRIHVKGNLSLFPGGFYAKFCELEKKTEDNVGFDLYYFLNYDTLNDLRRAIHNFTEKADFNFKKILAKMDEPDNIDIIIRTGGHHRLSGFTPIRSPNAEIFFVDEYFPDLASKKIKEIILAHKKNVTNNGK